MFGPVLLNILAISRWVVFVVSTPQGYYRNGYRYGDVDANKEGTYRTFGRLGGDDGYGGRSIGYGRYGGDTGSRDVCPYDNEKTFRKKRDVSEEETIKLGGNGEIFLQRLRRHDAYYRDDRDRYDYDRDRDRYRDDRFNDDRYGDDR